METDAKEPEDRDARQGKPDAPRVVHVPRNDVTPDGELAVLATVYAFVLKCREDKAATTESGDDEDGSGIRAAREPTGECPGGKGNA